MACNEVVAAAVALAKTEAVATMCAAGGGAVAGMHCDIIQLSMNNYEDTLNS